MIVTFDIYYHQLIPYTFIFILTPQSAFKLNYVLGTLFPINAIVTLSNGNLLIFKHTNSQNCYWDAQNYTGVIMSAMASQITSLTKVYSSVYSGADLRKRQISALLAFLRGIVRWPVNSRQTGPVTPKIFPFDDVIRDNPITIYSTKLRYHSSMKSVIMEGHATVIFHIE